MAASSKITIIGGGLAGSEAAYQCAKRGAKVEVLEMKPIRFSPAHTMETLAELVCSNSLKSLSIENASGILKEEMRLADSLVIKAADSARVPAGAALAVDRAAFSAFITNVLKAMGVSVIRGEVIEMPCERPLIIATGPLTSDEFAVRIKELVGTESLYFYDAVAPIIYKESIDLSKAFMASRYGKGGGDYLNCPLSEEEYSRFVEELTKADCLSPRAFEDMKVFESCMPVEALAERGFKTLVFGPMRPVGLIDPKTGKRPFAVVQLRMENLGGTLYNMVGFQTRLPFSEQKRVFRLIPALESAEFARYGKLHRNTYISSPGLIENSMQFKKDPGIFFAGQLTGVEGYCESAASGLIAGVNGFRRLNGLAPVCPPSSSMTGALLSHVSSVHAGPLQPMNVNFGLLPPIPGKDARERQARRAIEAFGVWANEILETSRTF